MALSKYSKYVKPYLQQIKELKSNGATERQIADELNISYASFNNYKIKYKELQEALELGNSILATNLRGSLAKRALGFYMTEEKDTIIKNDDGTTTTKHETNKKYYPPDVTSCVVLLKNYDNEFTNDDFETRKRKDKELEIKEKNSDKEEW